MDGVGLPLLSKYIILSPLTVCDTIDGEFINYYLFLDIIRII